MVRVLEVSNMGNLQHFFQRLIEQHEGSYLADGHVSLASHYLQRVVVIVVSSSTCSTDLSIAVIADQTDRLRKFRHPRAVYLGVGLGSLMSEGCQKIAGVCDPGRRFPSQRAG